MIPKLLHLCWLSGDKYPPLIEKCIETWKEKCPDYQVKIWDTKSFDLDSSIWVQQAFEQKKYAFAADYIRLWAVYNYGGIYLDSDVQVVKTFDDLLTLTSFMGFAINGNYEPAVFGAVAGQEWVGKCLEYYSDRTFIKPDGSLDLRTLPEIINPILKKEYRLDPNVLRTSVHNVVDGSLTLFPYTYFSPDIHNLKIDSDTYTVHHFAGSWVSLSYRIRSRVFGYIASNRILFYVYTNTFQRCKKWIKRILFKQDYYIFKHKQNR